MLQVGLKLQLVTGWFYVFHNTFASLLLFKQLCNLILKIMNEVYTDIVVDRIIQPSLTLLQSLVEVGEGVEQSLAVLSG